MRKPSEIQGVLVRERKTFYYLETGNMTVTNHLDRIMKVLVARDILTYTGTKEDVTEEKVKAITLLEAQEKGYAVEIFYLNAHIKANSNTPAIEVKKITWGKKE